MFSSLGGVMRKIGEGGVGVTRMEFRASKIQLPMAAGVPEETHDNITNVSTAQKIDCCFLGI